jgi:hypothetical protein
MACDDDNRRPSVSILVTGFPVSSVKSSGCLQH